jgi:hypothetical protein
MSSLTSSNNNIIKVTSNEYINENKSNDYVNKVFKYFVLELIKENDKTNILSESDMFNLINNKLDINETNIDTHPECIRNLYEDVMKLKNNYLFAYYLSRLYENRLYNNNINNAQKYYDFSEYIIGLNVDFKTLDWSSLSKIKENNKELYNIYGEKMHSITNEFLNTGFIKEITDIENIDNILINKKNNILKEQKVIFEKSSLNKNYNSSNLKDNVLIEIEKQLQSKEFNNKIINIIKKYETNKAIEFWNKLNSIVLNLLKIYSLMCISLLLVNMYINYNKNNN